MQPREAKRLVDRILGMAEGRRETPVPPVIQQLGEHLTAFERLRGVERREGVSSVEILAAGVDASPIMPITSLEAADLITFARGEGIMPSNIRELFMRDKGQLFFIVRDLYELAEERAGPDNFLHT